MCMYIEYIYILIHTCSSIIVQSSDSMHASSPVTANFIMFSLYQALVLIHLAGDTDES
jgi:hypothetical protein